MKNPIQAFIEWYRSLAVSLRCCLAHMYVVLTTENTTDLVQSRDHSPENFEAFVRKKDFPVRVVARMVMVRAIFDFILMNRDQLTDEKTMEYSNIANIAEKQWHSGIESWKVLRSMELADFYFTLWLKSELLNIKNS